MNANTTPTNRSPTAASAESSTTDCLSGNEWCPGPDAGDDDPLLCFDCFGVDCVHGHEWCDGVLPRPKDRNTDVRCRDCILEGWSEV